jgi:hypothetical protein
VIVAAAYLGAMGLWIYVVMEGQFPSGGVWADLVTLALPAVQLAVGLLIGRWWALALPMLAVLLAVPAGYPDASTGEPLPIWFGMAFFSPLALLLVAAGVAVARWRAKPRGAAM